MSYETEIDADSVEFLLSDERSLEQRLASVDRGLAAILEAALEGRRPSVADSVRLLEARGNDLAALVGAADRIRADDVGDVVTYVVNRNVNWTNVCFVGCKFCAFAHLKGDEEAYNHDMDKVLGRIEEGMERGATEVCMQGGLNPEMPDDGYLEILRTVHEAFPALHIHAYSPMEVMYGARRMRLDYREYISLLIEAGLGSMPGTAAEILDDEVRDILSYKKLDVANWVEIVTTAHELGLPTTSTVMYGHIETPMHVARHIDLLRGIQERTGGFTEFVPLRFIWQNTALYDMAVYGTSRLMLRGLIDNLQTSWVKLGHELSTLSLAAGCNDVGGTLMEESISREAGADAGEYTSAEELCAMIVRMGRIPRQRNTLYGPVDGACAAGEDGDGHYPARRWRGGGQAPSRPGALN